MSKSVLVAGGAGFIGSHMVDALLERNYNVIVVDNLERGKVDNLKHCLNDIVFLKNDLSVKSLVLPYNIDIIIDFAAKVFGVKDLYLNPASLLSKNVKITLNLLDCASQLNVNKYIYISSSCVYDHPLCSVPHVEDDIYIPRTGYGLSKLIGEEAVRKYSEEFGFNYNVARIFNAYGPRESPISSHVIPDFMKKAYLCTYRKKSFNILGDGKQTRSFTYVHDIIDALLLLLNGKSDNEIFNIGSDEEISMYELASKILDLFDVTNITFNYLPVHPKDIRKRSANINKASQLLNWRPHINLDEGLKMFKSWFIPLLEEDLWK